MGFGIPVRNGIGVGISNYASLKASTAFWTPARIQTALWLDANDASTITLNGSTVSQWNDKSGNGRNAVQATAANQPGWGAGRNLILWSEQFQQATWSAGNAVTISANQDSAPDGTFTADKIIATAVNTAHYASQVVSVVNGQTYTLSCYFKAEQYNFAAIQFGGAGQGQQGISVNLTTGATSFYNGATIGSATSVGNGWWRVTLTVTSSDSSLLPLISVFNQLGGSGQFFTGNGTGGVYAWGAQLNPGTTADPYQQTTSAAQTLSTGLNGKATMAWPDALNNRVMATSASFLAQDVFIVARFRDGTQAAWFGAYQGVFGGGAGEYIGLIGDIPDNWYIFCDFQQYRRNGGAQQTIGSIITALPLPPSLLNSSRTDGAVLSTFGIGNDRNLALYRGWSGIIGEIIVLSSIASTETRQRIEGYLAWKWGLQANLPVSHPYYNLPPTV